MSNNSNLFLSIGKPIKDEYGRTVGKVASFALTPSGKFDGVFIESNDGKFVKQSMEHLKFNGAEVTFTSTLKSQASVLCDQIPLIWRKNQALKDLAEKRKISPDLYQELRNNFDAVLNQLKKDAQVLSDEANKEIARCNAEIKTLGYAVVNLELEHEIGQVDDQAYQSAFTLLQENLKRANTEKSAIELTQSKLSNIMLGDSSKLEQKTIITSIEPTTQETPNETANEADNETITDENVNETPKEPLEELTAEKTNEAPEETPEEASELPEPPVVVYVKEVGKAGI
jgi:vacuolar-type H+-ATPase subunit I/STV1